MRKKSCILVASIAAATGLTVINPATASPSSDPAGGNDSPAVSSAGHDRKGFYDSREGTPAQLAATTQETATDKQSASVRALRRSVGPDAMVSIDPVTGTPRNLSSRDGYLTAASSAPARRVAMAYVRQHVDALGLTRDDVATFHLRRSYTDPVGTTHLAWEQVVDGIPVFGNGLEAHVTDAGELISLQGSPVADLGDMSAEESTTPAVSAGAARSDAAEDVGGQADTSATKRANRSTTTVWDNGDRAGLVWFAEGDGVRLGWDTYTQAGDGLAYTHVVDATSGDVLYRRDLVDFDKGDAWTYENYPGAKRGGDATKVNVFKQGWLKRTAKWLNGKYAVAWSDVDDDNQVGTSEKTPVPGTKKHPQFTLKPLKGINPLCKNSVCTWDPETPNSWKKNRKADVTNAFVAASKYHDYLAKGPFGFTGAAGNFESNDRDPVLLNALDGADTADGLPDANHIDNANMATPPDGTPPTMQMYLWHQPGTSNEEDPFLPASGAFDTSVLLHEYTHGLSNRLVTDAAGNSTLNSLQAGSMGEAWSDYYAMDYLAAKGLVKDSPRKDGQVLEGEYVAAGQLFRTQAMDCPVDSKQRNCRDLDGARGGYTYGDVPTIGGSPEVHSSGEVWSQTLWDVREALGHRTTGMLATRAMELSPDDPSMLDMRNAILQADKVAYDGVHEARLWKIFANRGMGWFAGSTDGGDTRPAEDFKTPPAPQKPMGTLQGKVTDAIGGEPVEGAIVHITGHDSDYIGSFADTTDASGTYTIPNVPVGKYAKVVVSTPGYEVITKAVRVKSPGTASNWSIRKDYAAGSAGGEVTSFDGPDYTPYACGPAGAIDLSQGTGWGSTTGDDEGTPTGTPEPKAITVKLSEPIDITADETTTAFAVDPTATCGDSGSSSTGEYTIEVSADGESWETAVDGTGDNAFGEENRFVYTNVPSSVDAAGVEYVRFTMLSPQVPDFGTNCPDGPYGGCQYMDMTELEVFGTPAA
ncbi:M36 family metallopeptidase [Solicola gregarius]|uniref:M36 family metallopeptidase n=1 Tax=Solicola gregarius TaxID=2908642 RepID=A0AA46TKQ1_9ACTN|nr:M36 family metallopeptidase [Solicola gregarius]UYM07081.1 M36 family metallopeptidase [Solicola gregarius]